MCSAFTADCGFENNTIFLIGDVYCPNIKCSGKVCLHKKTFQSLGRSDFKCPQCASVCQVRNFPYESQTNSFFLSFGQGVYLFEESLKSIQNIIGDVFCPGKFCFNRDKCELCIKSEIHLWLWKVWSMVVCSQSSFILQEHVKTTQTDKTRFFFAKKMNSLLDRQLFIKFISRNQSPPITVTRPTEG